MAIIRADGLSLAYGTHQLLDGVSFAVEHGEKIAIVGRNGAGKSSLLKLINKSAIPDAGEIKRQNGLVVRYLAQQLPPSEDVSVFDFVAGGLHTIIDSLEKYQHLLEQGGSQSEVDRLHSFIEQTNGWDWKNKVERVLSRLGLDGEQQMDQLSGGWRRRVALAECLVSEPDLLLLDEPTNHLDLETIEWLEQTLQQFAGAILLISHDRTFIDNTVKSLWDIDRGRLLEFPAPFAEYFSAKQKWLEDEEKQNALFDKKLAAEEDWIRQGIKARRTRNEGRVRALKKLRKERQERRSISTTSEVSLERGIGSGKLVFVVENATLKVGEKLLFNDFSTLVLRGDKVGIVGPNGVGKTSLIKMLLGEIKPTLGSVSQGTRLNIAYFDQTRTAINPNLSIRDNVGEGRDFIERDGKPLHVISYLNEFGFGPERMQTPASSLSGGEINRLALAKFLIRPSNLLIFDEPTNDLDIETLELLESRLVEFDGTVIIISHDRQFLDNTVNTLWVFDGNTNIVEITGGFTEYQHFRKQTTQLPSNTKKVKVSQTEPSKTQTSQSFEQQPAPSKKKLSYKYQRELEQLPAELESLEAKISEIEQNLADADQTPEQQQELYKQLADLQVTLEQKLDRWEQLEQMAEG